MSALQPGVSMSDLVPAPLVLLALMLATVDVYPSGAFDPLSVRSEDQA